MPFRPEQFQALFDVIPFSGVLSGAMSPTAGSETAATISVPGARQGDLVIGAVVEDTESGSLTAQVNANDLVEFVFANATSGTITLGTPQVRGVVLRMKRVS